VRIGGGVLLRPGRRVRGGAVGTSNQPGTIAQSPPVTVWTGTNWALQSVPVLGRASAALNAVSCPTAGWCMAVGVTSSEPLALRSATSG
jgi:hypothetical protein